MKKYLTFLICVIALSAKQAQETMYGVRGGVGLSGLSFDQEVDFENDERVGVYFGGFVDFAISKKFSVMTEANFSSEGAKDEPYQLDFIQIPVQLRYNISDEIKIGAGPQFSFVTWDNQNVFAQYVFSVVGGIELMFTDMFFVDLRYTYGITNVLEEPNDNEAQHSGFQLGIGIKL
jgi:opacity protein-like surface antigen